MYVYGGSGGGVLAELGLLGKQIGLQLLTGQLSSYKLVFFCGNNGWSRLVFLISRNILGKIQANTSKDPLDTVCWERKNTNNAYVRSSDDLRTPISQTEEKYPSPKNEQSANGNDKVQ